MKIETMARSARRETREAKDVIPVSRRNLDERQHPFASAREYQRAVVAAKLDRMMAKPFICALDAHRDSVTCLAVAKYASESTVVQALSGSADGELRLWDLAQRCCCTVIDSAHSCARGVTFIDSERFASCGDRFVRLWRIGSGDHLEAWTSDGTLNDVDFGDTYLATASAEGKVEVWRVGGGTTTPVRSYSWRSAGANTYRARWNPAQRVLIASCSRDRSVTLYDVRQPEPAQRCVLASRANCISWNPRDPTTLLCGLESNDSIALDVRSFTKPRLVFRDHVAAVVDIDCSPTGREFTTVSSDRTVRFFSLRGAELGKSRDCYHTHRMHLPSAVRYTADATYVLTASDDANLRLWKTQASTKLGGMASVNKRHQASLDYRHALLVKHRHLPQVRQIARHRNLPKLIKKLKLKQQQHREKARTKLNNRILHSKPGTAQPKQLKSTVVLTETG